MKAMIEQLTSTEQERIVYAALAVFPKVLPANWRKLDSFANGGRWLSTGGMCVMGEVEQVDGRLWIHVSVSRTNRLPDWNDLRAVKNLFMGAERRAVQNLPPESEYYNYHPYCLHMYSPFGHEPIPDFRANDGRI
jgi:hypothetical protein